MSRIGKRPVPVPVGVQAAVEGQTIKVKGPKGELSVTLPEEIKVEKTATGVTVAPREDTKRARSMWGMSRTLIDNQIKGVVTGYAQTLEIQGVGFRAQMKGKDLTLQLGFSHEINYKIPAGVDIKLAGAKQEAVAAVPDEYLEQTSLVGSVDRIRRGWEERFVGIGLTGVVVRSEQDEALELLADLAGTRDQTPTA